jgi:hypothetical protein
MYGLVALLPVKGDIAYVTFEKRGNLKPRDTNAGTV